MSDVSTTPDEGTDQAPAGDGEGEGQVDPSAAISRGVGLSFTAAEELDKDSPAGQAWARLKEFSEEYNARKEAFEALSEDRMKLVYQLKNEHGIGFSAMAEVMGVTSSLVLYLHERAQGKSAKQIREESVASNLAKQANRTSDPNRKPPRKQSPEEKELRKRQREELRRFLEEQRAAAEARGDSTEDADASLLEVDAEAAADDDT